MKNYFFTTFFTLLALLLIIACADVRITHSWQSSSASQNRYNKILVVGLFTNKDRALREQMETHLQGDLQALGIHAVSAIKLYGPTSFEQTNEDAFLSKIEGDGMDAALTIVLLDRKKEKHYVPGRVYFSPFYSYHTRIGPYWGIMYDRIYSPGYYQSTTRYFWESNIYDLKTKQLIYSVQTETFDPDEASSLAHQYGKVIVNDIKDKNILK
ncbi:MAG: hypothetical protein RL185_1166 [Bacteroidota bacterium]